MPIFSIILWTYLVPISVLVILFRLRYFPNNSGPIRIVSTALKDLLPLAIRGATFGAVRSIVIFNAPAKFLDVAISLLISHRGNWYPVSMGRDGWEAISYPFLAVPAWCFVGRGLDFLSGKRRAGLKSFSPSLILSLLSLFFAAGLRFGLDAADRQEQTQLFIFGFFLWTILFAIPGAAWIHQKRKSS